MNLLGNPWLDQVDLVISAFSRARVPHIRTFCGFEDEDSIDWGGKQSTATDVALLTADIQLNESLRLMQRLTLSHCRFGPAFEQNSTTYILAQEFNDDHVQYRKTPNRADRVADGPTLEAGVSCVGTLQAGDEWVMVAKERFLPITSLVKIDTTKPCFWTEFCSALHVSYLDLSDCELSSSHMAGLVRWLERRSTPSQLLGFKPEPGADNSTLILHGNAPAGRIGKDLPIPGQSGKVSAAIC
eukprot:COSAG04_NODE_5084_length_1745_cov_3.155640_1_plen_242_part_00